jgi:hypothetical protein
VRRREFEVVVGTEERQFVPDAQLREQRIDAANLNSGSPTGVSQRSGEDVVFAVLEQRKRSKALDDLRAGFRPGETLQQLLQYEPRGHDDI